VDEKSYGIACRQVKVDTEEGNTIQTTPAVPGGSGLQCSALCFAPLEIEGDLVHFTVIIMGAAFEARINVSLPPHSIHVNRSNPSYDVSDRTIASEEH
jgi:hypothetical protein